jgi:hypothetical protein
VELNDSATITVAVRTPQNPALLRRGGATSVITSSESAADCWSCHTQPGHQRGDRRPADPEKPPTARRTPRAASYARHQIEAFAEGRQQVQDPILIVTYEAALTLLLGNCVGVPGSQHPHTYTRSVQLGNDLGGRT